jgi:hypothetical protein
MPSIFNDAENSHFVILNIHKHKFVNTVAIQISRASFNAWLSERKGNLPNFSVTPIRSEEQAIAQERWLKLRRDVSPFPTDGFYEKYPIASRSSTYARFKSAIQLRLHAKFFSVPRNHFSDGALFTAEDV